MIFYRRNAANFRDFKTMFLQDSTFRPDGANLGGGNSNIFYFHLYLGR